jgi:hypothetical protein
MIRSTQFKLTNTGPTVIVTHEPLSYYRQPTTEAPTGQYLYIAYPTVFVFIILCIFGGCHYNRKHRQIGLRNAMGRRAGYGIGKSGGQRLRKKEDPIQLQDHDTEYRDDFAEGKDFERPRDGRRERADSDLDSDLRSLVGSPAQGREG